MATMMDTTRSPVVAGLFYPADPEVLAASVAGYLAHGRGIGRGIGGGMGGGCELSPKAVIAPHAGYEYSGAVAGSAFAALKGAAAEIKRVVLLGPSHRVAFYGLAASYAHAFRTPLGSIPVDRAAIDSVVGMRQVVEMEAAHAKEHCLEVELPFLQAVLGDFTLVPLVVGDVSYEAVGEVLDALWGGGETLIVVSSDLSHYLNYAQAQALDNKTRGSIEALRPEDLSADQACGRIAIGGLLLSARKRGMHVSTLDMRNSGDTAGSKDWVVGYGAYAVA